MNALEATIRDAMEDMGMLDPEEEVIAHIAEAVDTYLIDEGWTRPPQDSEEYERQKSRAHRDEQGRELPHPDEAT